MVVRHRPDLRPVAAIARERTVLNGGECNPNCNPGDPLIELADEAESEGVERSVSLEEMAAPLRAGQG